MDMITRRRSGKSFRYFYKGKPVTDPTEIRRINSIAVPPAWKRVEISPKSGKILATGYDAKGRKQSIYNPAYRKKQEAKKYQHVLQFAEHLPKLRQQVAKDLKRPGLGKERVIACVVSLLDEYYFRIGNKKYAVENNHYGLTTLRSKHIVDMNKNHIVISFVGKSGQDHLKKITDPGLVKLIKRLDDTPGYELFRYKQDGVYQTVSAQDVNEYIQHYTDPSFSAKYFRTWGATLLATSYLMKLEENQTPKSERRKNLTAIIKKVARRLGNTPAIAKQSYIDPRVIEAFTEGSSLSRVKSAMKNMKPKKYRSIEEQCVLRLLAT